MSMPVVLLVDDEKTVLDSLKRQLRSMFGRRFRYEVAESAGEGWEVIEEVRAGDSRIAAVVSDWMMPDVRGDAFLSRIRELDDTISLIMLTGFAEQEAVSRVQEAGILHRLLRKPWDPDELREAITSACEASGVP